MACHPVHARFNSSRSRLSAISFSIAVTSRHFPFSPSGHHFPFPYSPSNEARICASSFCAFGSSGAGNPAANSNSSRFRASSGDNCSPSKRCASFAYFAAAVFAASPASAAICSVSSVMKFSCTHPAREAFTPRSNNRCSASSINFCASGDVAEAFFPGSFAAVDCPAADPRANTTIAIAQTK